MGLNRKAQTFLLAVGLLAYLVLLAVYAQRHTKPSVVFVRDYLQDAMLIDLARGCIANQSQTGLNLGTLLNESLTLLYKYNRTLQLNIQQVVYTYSFYNDYSSNGYYKVEFSLPQPPRIVFYAEWRILQAYNIYRKNVGGRSFLLLNCTLQYYHNYSGAWGYMLHYPKLWDPKGIADIKHVGNGTWLIGIPLKGWKLVDNFGIVLKVKG